MIKSQEVVAGCVLMKSKEIVSTSIKVPVEKYEVLAEIKKATGKNIQDLILEGIDLIIINRAEEALKEVDERRASIKDIISKIKEDKQ